MEAVTDGIKGWVAYQNDATKYLVFGDQDKLNDKIKQLNTKEDRFPVILHAVTEHRTEFLPVNFTPGIILAMIAQDYSNGAECLQYTHIKDKELTIFDENENCKCKHYTNTIQGIEANIKDGLYVLIDKYNCQCCYDRGNDAEWGAEEGLYRDEMGGEVIFYSREEECKGSDGLTYDSRIEKIKIGGVQITCNEFKVIDAVWRYNGRSIYPEGSCMGNDYLRCVADRLNEIGSTFGYEMPDKDVWIECLKAVSRSASVMKRIK